MHDGLHMEFDSGEANAPLGGYAVQLRRRSRSRHQNQKRAESANGIFVVGKD